VCTVPTGRTYSPTANPHGIIFQKTEIFTIAVTALHLVITSHCILWLMPCSVPHKSLLLSQIITTADVTNWALGLSFCSQLVSNLWSSSQGHVQTNVCGAVPDQVSAQSYNHVTFVGPSQYQAKEIKVFQDITLCWLIFLHSLPSEMKALQLHKGQELHVQCNSSSTIVQKSRNYTSSDIAAV
jgi:hypothetical protein